MWFTYIILWIPSIRVVVEDKESSGGTFSMKVSPTTPIEKLQQEVRNLKTQVDRRADVLHFLFFIFAWNKEVGDVYM